MIKKSLRAYITINIQYRKKLFDFEKTRRKYFPRKVRKVLACGKAMRTKRVRRRCFPGKSGKACLTERVCVRSACGADIFAGKSENA